LRKALLVIAMVAASFAGGAVVNGPLLAWFRSATGLDAAPIEPIEPADLAAPMVRMEAPPEPTGSAPSPAGANAPAVPTRAIAADPPAASPEPTPTPPEPTPADEAPKPLELGGTPPPLAAPSGGPVAEAPAPSVGASPAPAPEAAAKGDNPATDAAREAGWGDAPGSAPAFAFLPNARPGSPRLDPTVTPAALPSDASGSARSGPAPKANPAPAEPATTPAPGPDSAPAPALTAPATAPAGQASAAASGSAWESIRRKMTALGVSRYWVEGEPSGPVRFRCIVPLAAGGAVAQQFEAEANDAPAAAEAALRRIALWRATERR
jgi:hypothetical protein